MDGRGNASIPQFSCIRDGSGAAVRISLDRLPERRGQQLIWRLGPRPATLDKLFDGFSVLNCPPIGFPIPG